MYTFLQILVVASTLLHATLGCHAHHVHAVEGDMCCAPQSKKSDSKHKQQTCGHSHKSHSHATPEKSCRPNANRWLNGSCQNLPGEPCSTNCDGQSCNWWQGREAENQKLLADALPISPAILQVISLQNRTQFAVNNSPPPSRLPNIRVHLLLQVLLI